MIHGSFDCTGKKAWPSFDVMVLAPYSEGEERPERSLERPAEVLRRMAEPLFDTWEDASNSFRTQDPFAKRVPV